MSTKSFPLQTWYTYVQNDPVNYVDLWGLQCQKETDKKDNLFQDNRGKWSSDPYVVNGVKIGERAVAEQKSNSTTTVEIYTDNTIKVSSSVSTMVGVISFDGTFNNNNAANGTLKMYDLSAGVITITPSTPPVAIASIVSGGNNFYQTRHGIYLDIEKENIMKVSNSAILKDGNHGNYYYRLDKSTGEALHLGNQNNNIYTQTTEGCSAITGVDQNSLLEKNYQILEQGAHNATFIVF